MIVSTSSPPFQPSTAICYGPLLLPEELLYSWLARLVAYNSLGDPRTCVKFLFGARDVIPGIDLPTRLDTLSRRMGYLSPYDDADDLIDSGTIYPYHRPFLTIERDEAVRHILLHGGGTGLKTLLGRVANRFGASPPLRYCDICLAEDIAFHGTPYWHKSHQLPGVSCCATHRVNLTPYVLPSTLTNKQRFVLPPGRPNRVASLLASNAMQFWLAVMSQNLLTAKLPVLDPQRRKAIYEEAARARGFCTKKDRIDHDALVTSIRRHYNDFTGFEHRERLLSTPLHPLDWLHTLFDRPSRALHPICHLLLIGFLFETIDEFKKAITETNLSSNMTSPPNLCNASPSFPDIGMQNELMLRNTSYSCRAVAQALNLSVTTVVSRRRALGIPIAERRKYLLADRLTAITSALAEGLSPSSIARNQHVSQATVYRVRAQSTKARQAHIELRYEQTREKHRTLWQQASNKQDNNDVRKVREKAAASYIWLYRHDRAWIKDACKNLHPPSPRAPRVDWNARDITLCVRLEGLVASLKRRSDRPRISKTLMLRDLGDAMVRTNLARLPRLQAALEGLVESRQAFHLVRIDRAIEQLTADGLPLQLWRIQRLAGIHKFTAMHRAYAQLKTARSA